MEGVLKNQNILINGLKSFGLDVSDKQIMQFERYYEMLVEKNKVMNLTAITEYDDVMLKHFVDSLSIAKVAMEDKKVAELLNSENCSLLDLGTGAGFPGLPIKIMYPKIKITLMDSLNKRINFLNEVIDELELENIEAVHARAEEFAGKAEYREQYDFVVSRAVAKMSTLTEYCFGYVKKGGYFLPYKAGAAIEEIHEGGNAVKVMGGKLESINEFCLPDSEISRCIPIVRKIENTPKKYPRVGRKAEKNPL